MFPAKAALLVKLEENRAKWLAHNIPSYELVLEKSCYCLFGPAYGPNRVVVRGRELKFAEYRGRRRDGYRNGDLLPRNVGTQKTVDGLFADLHESISQSTENAEWSIQYDENYGYPVSVSYDRPDRLHEEYTLAIISFFPNKTR